MELLQSPMQLPESILLTRINGDQVQIAKAISSIVKTAPDDNIIIACAVGQVRSQIFASHIPTAKLHPLNISPAGIPQGIPFRSLNSVPLTQLDDTNLLAIVHPQDIYPQSLLLRSLGMRFKQEDPKNTVQLKVTILEKRTISEEIMNEINSRL